MTFKRRKTKRKVTKYKSGRIFSKKNHQWISYKSGWEKATIKFLESNKDVICFSYEPFAIPYNFDGQTKLYYPDFLITYKDNSQILVEVKRLDQVADPMVVAKRLAAEEWSNKTNIPYQTWTDKYIQQFKLLTKIKR